MTAAPTKIFRVLMLDPTPESEREFMESLLPDDGFAVSATADGEAAPRPPACRRRGDRDAHAAGDGGDHRRQPKPEAGAEVRRQTRPARLRRGQRGGRSGGGDAAARLHRGGRAGDDAAARPVQATGGSAPGDRDRGLPRSRSGTDADEPARPRLPVDEAAPPARGARQDARVWSASARSAPRSPSAPVPST